MFLGFFLREDYVSRIEGLDLVSRPDPGEINQSWHGIGLDALLAGSASEKNLMENELVSAIFQGK